MYLNTIENSNYECPLYRYYAQRDYEASLRAKDSIISLSNTFRTLWEQHAAWTRMAIISMVFDLPDVELVTNRLLKNPVDFSNALKVYYGNKIASKFSDLLKEHLVLAAQLVKAAKAGDNSAAAAAEKSWYKNANDIAEVLSSINPYWSKDKWRNMLHTHLMFVKAEAVNMLTKNYEAGINVYDRNENQVLEMADELTQGIIKQFPNRFK